MKVYARTVAHWTSLFGILIIVNETLAQIEPTLSDLVSLCNKRSTLYCELLETYRQLDELQKLNDEDHAVKFKNRNHVGPRFALYDNTGDTPQYPFSSGWKGRLGKQTSDVSAKMRRMQSRKPFNYDRKRTQDDQNLLSQDTANNKREPAFSSWGGKRTQFFNWGGKRSVPENELNDALIDDYKHNIMRRNVNAPPFNEITTEGREKKICTSDSINIQELFKEFLEWSRKQPEQKKGSIYRKMFSVSSLHSPDNLSRRAGSFYPWGG